MQNNYRNEAKSVYREARWTFWKFLPLAITAAVVIFAIGFALNSLGLIGKTAVERKVFENSYQRSEGIKAQIAQEEATLAEISSKLANPNLRLEIRAELEAQAAAARVRLRVAKAKQ